MAVLDRIPGSPTRERRALEGIGSDFVPYTGAIKDVDLGSFDLTTTGLGTFGNLDVDTLNLNANIISDSTGAISFDDENLTTTGWGRFDSGLGVNTNPTVAIHVVDGEINVVGRDIPGESETDGDDAVDMIITGGRGQAAQGTAGKGADLRWTAGKGGAGVEPAGVPGVGGDIIWKIWQTVGASFNLKTITWNATYNRLEHSDGEFDFHDNNLLTTGTVTGANLIVSQNSDTLTLSHDGSHAYIKTSDGAIILTTDEGTNTTGIVEITGKGTEYGLLKIRDQNDAEYIQMLCSNGYAFLSVEGISPQAFEIDASANGVLGTRFFSLSAGGENRPMRVYGFPTGLSRKYFQMQIADRSGTVVARLTSDSGEIDFNNENLQTAGDVHIGNATDYMDIVSSGDVVFVGGAGLPFGCLEGLDETVTCTDQNTWYQVTFDTAGPVNNIEADTTNNELQVTHEGIYDVAVVACFHSGVSHDFELMVKKTDGTVPLAPHLFQTTAVADKVENAAGSCLIDINADDRVELWIRCTDAAGQDAIFDHVSLTLTQVGGT